MKRKSTILVVDDDRNIVDWLTETLQEEGFVVESETDSRRALKRVEVRGFDVVISDVEMPGLRGVDLVRSIHKTRPRQAIILITAFGSIDLAMESVRAGAVDFLAKPFRIEALLLAIKRALREQEMSREIARLRAEQAGPTALVARSDVMRRVVEVVQRAARSELPILFTGESGVGKGALARYAFECSERREGPFVTLNCAALPSSLAEAELFGARRGAFTDAKEDRAGVFEQAHRGTLLLDEIGELPLDIQPKLLQVLESNRVRPLGGGSDVVADVRILAATNQPLEEALRQRTFRADLYHRLNVVRVDIPPLRERTDEIDPIVDEVLALLSKNSPRGVLTVTTAARQWLRAQSWPGNVRELINAVQRAAALSDNTALDVEDFAGSSPTTTTRGSLLDDAADAQVSLAQLERLYIAKVLRQTGGNKAKAAKVLGLDRRTLYRKVAEMQASGAFGASEPEDGDHG